MLSNPASRNRTRNNNRSFRLAVFKQALAGLLCFSAFVVAAEESPASLLERMKQRLSGGNYELSLVVVDGQSIEPVQVINGQLASGQVTVINYLNGPPRHIVRIGQQVSYFEADGSSYSLAGNRIAGPLPGAFWNDISALAGNYDFVLSGRGRTAGRLAQLVRVTPHDELRYGGVLWLDEESGMLLRMDLVTAAGELVEQVQVVNVAVTPEPSPLLATLSVDQLPPVVHPPQPLAADGSPLRWSLGWVPPGFEVRYHDHHRLVVTDDPVDYYLLSDGLVELSVYIQPEPERREPRQAASHGATGIYTTWHNGIEVAVVGRLPLDTLARVAAGVLTGVVPPAPAAN